MHLIWKKLKGWFKNIEMTYYVLVFCWGWPSVCTFLLQHHFIYFHGGFVSSPLQKPCASNWTTAGHMQVDSFSALLSTIHVLPKGAKTGAFRMDNVGLRVTVVSATLKHLSVVESIDTNFLYSGFGSSIRNSVLGQAPAFTANLSCPAPEYFYLTDQLAIVYKNDNQWEEWLFLPYFEKRKIGFLFCDEVKQLLSKLSVKYNWHCGSSKRIRRQPLMLWHHRTMSPPEFM